MSQSPDIAFIGSGNMATSLIGGLIARGTAPDTIRTSDSVAEQREAIGNRFGVRTSSDNALAASGAGVVVLAVKPQQMEEATRSIAGVCARHSPLVISIAAGVRVRDIRDWLGADAAIVRTMPNTPALVGEGATALYANEHVAEEGRGRAEAILAAVGSTVWVDDEALLDAVTALSGSGPAYFFLLMELMERNGVALGLDRETARALTLQTALGAARVAQESGEAPQILRERVTSAGGTTERALQRLAEGDIEDLFAAALRAARDRSVELGQASGGG
jgi:pyrroline-5-carboxylate reductase